VLPLVTLAGFVQEISPFGFGHVAMHHLTEYPFNRRFGSRVTLTEHREPPRGGDRRMHPEVSGLSGENLTTVSLAFGSTTRSGDPANGVSGDVSDSAHGGGVPTVEKRLKVLTEKLDLTGDQQAKIKPILQELHDATQKLVQGESMLRLGNVRAWREKADKKVREILNDDQKKKLDQLEQ